MDERGGPRVVDRRRANHPHDGVPIGGRRGHDAGVNDLGIGARDLHHLLGLSGWDGDERGRRRSGPERLDEHLVAITAGPPVVDDSGAGHSEVHADRREHERAEKDDPDREHGPGPSQGESGPPGPTTLGDDVGILLVARNEHLVAKRDKQCREQRQRCQRDRDDGQDHPERHRAEHHHRHEEHCGKREHDGEGGEEHGLAGGGQRVLHRRDGVFAFDPFLAVSADDEEAVVDPHRETDHHRKVHRPHRQRCRHAEQVQQREPDRDAGEGEQEWERSRDHGTECEEQQHHRRDAADELGLVERLFVDLVEVAPHRPLPRHSGLRAGGERESAHVAAERAGGNRPARVGSDCEVHGNDRGAAVARDEPGVSRESERIRDGTGSGRATQRPHERLKAAAIRRDRRGLVVDHDRVLGAEGREVLAQFVSYLLRCRSLCFPARARERPGQRERQRSSRERHDQPNRDDHPAMPGHRRGETREERTLVRRCGRFVSGRQWLGRR